MVEITARHKSQPVKCGNVGETQCCGVHGTWGYEVRLCRRLCMAIGIYSVFKLVDCFTSPQLTDHTAAFYPNFMCKG